MTWMKSLAGAAVLALLAGGACADASAAPSAGASAPAAPNAAVPPGWKVLFENSQSAYYLQPPAPAAAAGELQATTVLEFKIPEVLGGAQVWSIVAHLRLACDRQQLATSDNTLYASPLGAGPVVSVQRGDLAWRPPQPGSIGEMILRESCPKPSAPPAPPLH